MKQIICIFYYNFNTVQIEMHITPFHHDEKYLSAWRPSLLGITVYKDVMSIVKMILFSPEKLKLRNVSSAWLLSLIYT